MSGRGNRYGGVWPAFRLTILNRDLWTCQRCGVILTSGRIKPNSAVVHHIVKVEDAPGRRLDPSNVEAICKACHDGEAQAVERGGAARIGADGWPVG